MVKTQIGIEDYAGHSFEPDRDFVNSSFEERHLGEIEHSEMQGAVLHWFGSQAKEWSIKLLPAMRVQTGPERFRVADIAVVSAKAPREKILVTPPLLVIEILSPEDRVSRYHARLEDYRRMGVRAVWVIDPGYEEGEPVTAYDCSTGDWVRAERLSIPGTPVTLSIRDLVADQN